MSSSVPHADELPDALTERDQWLCWRTQRRGGVKERAPIDPRTHLFGSASDPDSWTDFGTAREYAVEDGVDGLGFGLTDEDPLCVVELDDCRDPDDGALAEDALSVVEELAAYTEVEPSGRGVTVIVEGRPPRRRLRPDWIEWTDAGDFVAVTGRHVDGTPVTVTERTTELHAVYEDFLKGLASDAGRNETAPVAESDVPEVVPEDGASTPAATEPGADVPTRATASRKRGPGLADEEIVRRARQGERGETFARLWEGDTGEYETHARADTALCALLAFWTGENRAQLDRLFRQSGLMRPKWDGRVYEDGSTYGEVTICRVLASADSFYDPDRSRDDPTSDGSDTDGSGSPRDAEDGVILDRVHEDQESPPTREMDEMALISDLQHHVEQLQTANEHLTAERERLEEELEGARASLEEAEDRLERIDTSRVGHLRRFLMGSEFER